MDRIWLTGFRSYELGVSGAKDPKLTIIKYAIRRLLLSEIADGAEWLITGGQLGIEQWAIETALALEDDGQRLQIALMTPFEKFGAQWNEGNQEKLTQLKTTVDFTAAVSRGDYSGPSQLRSYQQFMLEHTDGAIIFYDDEATESKARYDYEAAKAYSDGHDYPVRLIDFDRLQDFATEYQESLWN
jgi:uncharacterized phage-like protein YoqJ